LEGPVAGRLSRSHSAFPAPEEVEEEGPSHEGGDDTHRRLGGGHDQWVFTAPKMLRVYFLYHRELLGELSRAAAETARELLASAAGEEEPRSLSHLRPSGRP
jgi:hypothetical protein